MKKIFSLLTLALAASFVVHGPAIAQVAGATSIADVSVVESTQVALGWSVKNTLLGKTIYNEAGKKVGKVQDIIIAPDKSVSYIIVQAGWQTGAARCHGRQDPGVSATASQPPARSGRCGWVFCKVVDVFGL